MHSMNVFSSQTPLFDSGSERHIFCRSVFPPGNSHSREIHDEEPTVALAPRSCATQPTNIPANVPTPPSANDDLAPNPTIFTMTIPMAIPTTIQIKMTITRTRTMPMTAKLWTVAIKWLSPQREEKKIRLGCDKS